VTPSEGLPVKNHAIKKVSNVPRHLQVTAFAKCLFL